MEGLQGGRIIEGEVHATGNGGADGLVEVNNSLRL